MSSRWPDCSTSPLRPRQSMTRRFPKHLGMHISGTILTETSAHNWPVLTKLPGLQQIAKADLELLTQHEQRLARARQQTRLTKVSAADMKQQLQAFRSRLRAGVPPSQPAAPAAEGAGGGDAPSASGRDEVSLHLWTGWNGPAGRGCTC